MIRGVGWQILFNSLNLYESRFNQILQSTGTLLPVFQEGDARALEAYLRVLKKVILDLSLIEENSQFKIEILDCNLPQFSSVLHRMTVFLEMKFK
jgi:hypothetical protein